MARVNVEDTIYKDERFHKLSAAEGKYKAIGLCVTAWELAHYWYLKHPHKLVPFAEWEKNPDLKILEEHGLAIRLECGIYVKGSKDHCGYLSSRQEAGRKGGLKTQENFSSKVKQIKQNQPSVSVSVSVSKTTTATFEIPDILNQAINRLMPHWRKCYEDEWIEIELNKAKSYIMASGFNPKLNADTWINQWLARADRDRKQTKIHQFEPKQKQKTDYEKMKRELGEE